MPIVNGKHFSYTAKGKKMAAAAKKKVGQAAEKAFSAKRSR